MEQSDITLKPAYNVSRRVLSCTDIWHCEKCSDSDTSISGVSNEIRKSVSV